MVTVSRLWGYEQAYSPAGKHCSCFQLVKIGEEYGELCSAYLQDDTEQMKDELADLINTCLGLATIVYGSSGEFESRLRNAIAKMANKYSDCIDE